ncbi:ECF transporter S component [Fusibacter sp. JL298sf-3]
MVKSSKHTQIAVKDIVLTGLLIALVFVSTLFINIQLPVSLKGGLIHMGNVALFLSAILFGKNKGALAGAFGMGLFDIVGGWYLWAPFTFVIRGVMGYIVGAIAYSGGAEGKSFFRNALGILLASLWMIPGYYITEVILYHNWITPLTSIPGDVIQLVFGTLALFVAPMIMKAMGR